MKIYLQNQKDIYNSYFDITGEHTPGVLFGKTWNIT